MPLVGMSARRGAFTAATEAGKSWRTPGLRKALSKMQAVGIIVIIVVAIIAAVYYATAPPATAPYYIQVIPQHIEDSVPGQRCVFLVVVEDEGEGTGKGEAVAISATAPGSTAAIDPQAITPQQVAEATVIPDEASVGKTLTVTIQGERSGLKQTEMVTVKVQEGHDMPWPYAEEVRDAFVPWLATNHPELGITSETEWTGTIVYPHILVVSYYLFFSEDWEMGVRWHVTRVPDDWAEIYLRRRFTETQPSFGFKIDSFKMEPRPEPHSVEPPESVWR